MGQGPKIGSRALWPASVAEARKVQERLAKKVRLRGPRKPPEYVAGVDAAFSENQVFAAACVYSYPALELVEETAAVEDIRFPYVPGFLSFREGFALIKAVRRLRRKPNVILVDGQGIAHPRRIGIASHVGVLLDIPTIGCAKSRLVGEAAEPGRERGNWTPLLYHGKIIGAVVRTKNGVRPLFISPGHRVNLAEAIELVLSCARGYRISEPLRRADALSKRMRRDCRIK
jgi:deoxyribonuclease V